MYSLAVAGIFKNEAHAIEEWIEHYLFHGVKHFYLIDDKSSDSSCSILEKYIEKGLVTLYKADWPYYLGRQRDIYNHYILPHLKNKEMKWLYIADLDEFLWSSYAVDLNVVLSFCNHLSQIQFDSYFFTSNGHITQPKSIVRGFTKRKSEIQNALKYIVNSDYTFTSLNVHHADYADKKDSVDTFMKLGDNWFILNHYVLQSREFWETVKCTRGDADSFRNRTIQEFINSDLNEVEDLGLVMQNKPLYD